MTSAVRHFARRIITARSAPSRGAACSTPSSTSRPTSPGTSRGRSTTDIIGVSGAPFHPATAFRNFQVKVAPDGKDLQIAPGRFYVDGILCENEAEPATFLAQPDLPGTALPTAAGSYAVYLDVWERHVTAGEQRADGFPSLREPALGGPDTASRVRVVWQVKLASVGSKALRRVHAAAVADGKAAGQRSACRRRRPTTAWFRRVAGIAGSKTSCIASKSRRSRLPSRPSSGRATTPARRAR